MASIFTGDSYHGIRSRLYLAAYTDINAATTSAFFILGTLDQEMTVLNIVNNSAAVVDFYVVGPKMDITNTANYFRLTQLGAQSGHNFDQSTTPTLRFPAGTTLAMAKNSGTAVSGDAVRVFAFG